MFFETAEATLLIDNISESPETVAIMILAGGLIALFWSLRSSRRILKIISNFLSYSRRGEDSTEWHAILASRFQCTRPLGSEIWKINFAESKHLYQETLFQKNQFGFFDVGHSAHETDAVLAPMLRKVILKYKSAFESEHSIHTMRNQSACHMMTWLHNPSQLRLAVFRFLDECMTLSENMKSKPELNINWDQEMTFTVMWHNVDEKLLTLFKNSFEPQPELITDFSGDTFSLKLCLAFNEEQLSQHISRLSSILRNQHSKMPSAS